MIEIKNKGRIPVAVHQQRLVIPGMIPAHPDPPRTNSGPMTEQQFRRELIGGISFCAKQMNKSFFTPFIATVQSHPGRSLGKHNIDPGNDFF